MLARIALAPGADAGARVAWVKVLARQTALSAPEAQPPPSLARARPVRTAAAARAKARVARAVAACRKRAPPARRVVCASPALRQADVRLRSSHARAIAAGVDRRRLAREQSRWRARVNAAAPNRAAVARLYQRRIAVLRAQARATRD
jgi:uncharacterized protein